MATLEARGASFGDILHRAGKALKKEPDIIIPFAGIGAFTAGLIHLIAQMPQAGTEMVFGAATAVFWRLIRAGITGK